MYSYLLKSFEFWWVIFQIGALTVLWIIVTQDFRSTWMIVGFCNVVTFAHMDCFPKVLSKGAPAVWVSNTILVFLWGLGLQFDIFPNILKIQFQFFATDWSINQLLQSTIWTFVIWLGRFAVLAISGQCIVLRANVQRLDYV